MLKKLSRRNAKRQAMDYTIYIITLVVTMILMLSFNMIVFSEEISVIIKEKSILPFIIVMVSIMVVFIMGVLVDHITVFILKRRSREFGLYMLLGIENEDIAGIFLRENRLIHGFILVVGVFLGTCFFQAVKAVICRMYAVPFNFTFEVSTEAVILTLFYMGIILWISSIRVKRAVRKLNVRELIYFDKAVSGDAKGSISTALVSVSFGIVGIAVMALSTVRNLPDIVNVLAVMFLAVSVYGFFVLLFRHLLSCLKNDEWKYHGSRLFMYGQLTAKMRSMLPLLAGASMLIMVALLAAGWAIYFMDKVDSRVEAVAFDVAFFKDEEDADFSPYLSYLNQNHELESSHGYSLYTSHDDVFYQQTKRLVQGKMGFYISGSDEDTFMCVSDYNRLRDMLDLPQVQIDSDSYVLHCTRPCIPESFRTDVLKEEADNNEVLVENAHSETAAFALLFEFDGDIRKIRHVLYNCSASRPKIEGKTNEESREVQTETLTIKARPLASGYVKAKTGNKTSAETYANWYKSVYLPEPKAVDADTEGQG